MTNKYRSMESLIRQVVGESYRNNQLTIRTIKGSEESGLEDGARRNSRVANKSEEEKENKKETREKEIKRRKQEAERRRREGSVREEAEQIDEAGGFEYHKPYRDALKAVSNMSVNRLKELHGRWSVSHKDPKSKPDPNTSELLLAAHHQLKKLGHDVGKLPEHPYLGMKTFREGFEEETNPGTEARTKIKNVARLDNMPATSPKSTLSKTAQINSKIIEGTSFMYSDNKFGLTASLINATREIVEGGAGNPSKDGVVSGTRPDQRLSANTANLSLHMDRKRNPTKVNVNPKMNMEVEEEKRNRRKTVDESVRPYEHYGTHTGTHSGAIEHVINHMKNLGWEHSGTDHHIHKQLSTVEFAHRSGAKAFATISNVGDEPIKNRYDIRLSAFGPKKAVREEAETVKEATVHTSLKKGDGTAVRIDGMSYDMNPKGAKPLDPRDNKSLPRRVFIKGAAPKGNIPEEFDDVQESANFEKSLHHTQHAEHHQSLADLASRDGNEKLAKMHQTAADAHRRAYAAHAIANFDKRSGLINPKSFSAADAATSEAEHASDLALGKKKVASPKDPKKAPKKAPTNATKRLRENFDLEDFDQEELDRIAEIADTLNELDYGQKKKNK